MDRLAEALEPVEVFHEGKECINVVLGALLGGYIGLAISARPLTGQSYWHLGYFLIGTIWFLTAINAATERFHRRRYALAFWYFVGSGAGLLLALPSAVKLPVDFNIVLITFLIWVIALSFEAATAGLAFFAVKFFRK